MNWGNKDDKDNKEERIEGYSQRAMKAQNIAREVVIGSLKDVLADLVSSDKEANRAMIDELAPWVGVAHEIEEFINEALDVAMNKMPADAPKDKLEAMRTLAIAKVLQKLMSRSGEINKI